MVLGSRGAVAAALFSCVSGAAFGWADHPRRAETVAVRSAAVPGSTIRVDVPLVLVPVTVTDEYEHLISDLRKEDFRLLEEGVEQKISSFHRDESPISVGILLDSSHSMERTIGAARKAISAFLGLCSPEDEYMLMRFATVPEELETFTPNPRYIEDAASRVEAAGWTALFDALYDGYREMKGAQHEKKVLLVLSDGRDNNSRRTESEIKRTLQEGDVRLFAISIFERSRVLEKLAESTGGRAYRIKTLSELPDVAAKISAELHSEYLLGYSPRYATDGRHHRIKVELVGKERGPMHASWRRSYFDPSR